jgi:mycothiol system anti-sigma-R factor
VGDKEVPENPAVPTGGHGGQPPGFVGCDETIERLYFYLDGELTEERRVEITQHLDLCGPCVGAYGFETELRKVIASRCRDHVPDELLTRVAEALREEHSRQSN